MIQQYNYRGEKQIITPLERDTARVRGIFKDLLSGLMYLALLVGIIMFIGFLTNIRG